MEAATTTTTTSAGALALGHSSLIPPSYTRDWTPAERFRRIVCELLPQADPVRFEHWLLQALRAVQHERAPSLRRYVIATGLLTYGHLEMGDVILANFESPPRGRGRTAYVVGRAAIWSMLPLPGTLRSPSDIPALRAWIRAHRGLIRWNPTRGRYDFTAP